MNKLPNILIFDIETSPIIAHVWQLWDQNVALNQIQSDWHVLSWSAKWLESSDKKLVYGPHRRVMYKDQRNKKNMENDKKLLEEIWKLLDAADIVITQNGKKFDQKKLNARFVLHGMKPPSPYKHIDTVVIARKHFGFTSNKLEYMTDKLCKKHKKSKHKKFHGHYLWRECLANNLEAWKEMESYNKKDVLSLEELYHVLSPWDNSINFNIYHNNDSHTCNCGSTDIQHRGYSYTAAGKYARFVCKKCGAWGRGAENLMSKEKRASLIRKV